MLRNLEWTRTEAADMNKTPFAATCIALLSLTGAALAQTGTAGGAIDPMNGMTTVLDGKPQLVVDASRVRTQAEREEDRVKSSARDEIVEEKVRGAVNAKAQGRAIGVANAKERQEDNANSAAGTSKQGAVKPQTR
ncbi:hypothetical protein [Piscinibacter sakaiensis]|uniref:hypothetical protein n=1 Tax=Piscinibacter sakaiensis TaxID=1547922 RepID=UPI003AAF6BF0